MDLTYINKSTAENQVYKEDILSLFLFSSYRLQGSYVAEQTPLSCCVSLAGVAAVPHHWNQ